MAKLSFLFLAIFIGISQFSLADEQTKLLSEFSGGLPYYELRTSKTKKRFFVVSPGPCACTGGLTPIVSCSSNLESDLAAQLIQKKADEKVLCDPTAGCVIAAEIIYAECTNKNQRRLLEKK